MNSNLKKLIFFVLLAGTTYFAHHLMISPANVALAEQKIRINKKLAKLTEIRKITATPERRNKELEQLEKAIAFFESKLPPKSDLHETLEQITIISQKYGLTPKTIRTLAKKKNNGYIDQPLKIQLVGDFKSFYSFLLELEQLPRIMKIRELHLAKHKARDGDITADFVVSIFFSDEFEPST